MLEPNKIFSPEKKDIFNYKDVRIDEFSEIIENNKVRLPSLNEHPSRNPSKSNVDFMDFSNFEMAWKTAEMISKARCIPKEFQGNPSDILVAIEFGNEIGLRPMASLQNIMIVNNKPSIYGDAMLAVCMAFPDFIDCIEKYDSEKQEASCTVKRKGREPITKVFNKKMAEAAKLWGKVSSGGIPSPWVTNPERMMQFRARGFALRDMFPDVLKGMPTVEEMRDSQIYETRDSNNLEIKNTVDSMKERLKSKQMTSENILDLNKNPICLTEKQNDIL